MSAGAVASEAGVAPNQRRTKPASHHVIIKHMSITAIIAQIFNGIGTLVNAFGITSKNKSKTLLLFIIGNIFCAMAIGLLGAVSGTIVLIIFVIETIINYFWEKKHNKYPLWLIAIYVIVPCAVLIFTATSFWDALPICAGILFPLALVSKDFALRALNLASVVVWIPYNFHFGQYVGAISCIIFSVINAIAIIRYDILKNKNAKINP